MRTVAKGSRLFDEDPIDNPNHRRILEHSPLSGADGQFEGDLLRRGILNDYLSRLNRHPARRVDIAVSSSTELGRVVLDYIVNERKPWVAYAQITNTGTEATGEWRERIGFIHYQLTDADDILAADFITSSFDQSNAALVSYQRPLFYPNYLVAKAGASWSKYTAEELGSANLTYEGQTIGAYAELRYSPFRLLKFDFDFTAGIRFDSIDVENFRVLVPLDPSQPTQVDPLNSGSGTLLTPYLRAEISRRERTWRVSAFADIEGTFTSAEDDEIDFLGRTLAADNTIEGHLGVDASTYLEPLIFWKGWDDPETWRTSTLAHEVNLRFRGQWAMDRLLAQRQFISGGMFSVRGYPENVAAGDGGYFINLEYNLHLPRLLRPSNLDDETPARWFGRYEIRPPSVYAKPDWDLILRGFFDYGQNFVVEPLGSEDENTLSGAGIGLEFQFYSYLTLRVDYATIMKTVTRVNIPVEDAEDGDSRLHILATFSW
ncbi:MAG: ShlB/FhaC/HecB family hemolysin secretion/activation protein [Verrucomicrobiae bacterium]|nr:ShlB/FhaC/HecB family hemolysin secretion/activation protein [Verrucomicrobiae bacterium]